VHRLKKGLPEDIKEWYELHSLIMESKVPTWIDARDIREDKHFLLLPNDELRRAYMKLFWEIRIGGLEEVFYERVEWVNKHCREGGKQGWQTDRGRVVLIAGIPHYVQNYRARSDGGFTAAQNIEGNTYLVWEYWFRGYLVRYVFCVKPGGEWGYIANSLSTMSSQRMLYEYMVYKVFAPTEQGWDEWGSYLYFYLKNNNESK